jgi:hypothetical protein
MVQGFKVVIFIGTIESHGCLDVVHIMFKLLSNHFFKSPMIEGSFNVGVEIRKWLTITIGKAPHGIIVVALFVCVSIVRIYVISN